jgi:hypothetical protein
MPQSLLNSKETSRPRRGRRDNARSRGLLLGDPQGFTMRDPLMRCSKRKGEGLQRNSDVFKIQTGDIAPFPRAHGPPKEPTKRIRSWSYGSSNGPVLAYAARILDTIVGKLSVPEWFYRLYCGRTQDFRRKYKNLPLWSRFKVTFIRLQYFRFQSGFGQQREHLALKMQRCGLVSHTLGFRLLNLPEAIRTSCRFIQSKYFLRPSLISRPSMERCDPLGGFTPEILLE